MKAVRIHQFGPPSVIIVEDIARPTAAEGEVLVRVAAAGVAPWDALIREGKSKVSPQPPLTMGSDLSGVIEEVGPDVSAFRKGDEVYGVTNPQFYGAQAEYAVAFAAMIGRKPSVISHLEAASVPVVAVTAWQMLFEYGNASAGDTVLILGAAGNVGAYAVQLAARAGLHVVGVARARDFDYLRILGAAQVLDSINRENQGPIGPVDLVLDMLGGDLQERASRLLKPGGILVSVVTPEIEISRQDVRAVLFYAEATTARLSAISDLLNSGALKTNVGEVLPISHVRRAHEMLAGAPHKRGKVVLRISS